MNWNKRERKDKRGVNNMKDYTSGNKYICANCKKDINLKNDYAVVKNKFYCNDCAIVKIKDDKMEEND